MSKEPSGSRHSRQRDVILQVLRSTNIHPTADWIYEQVRQEIPNISLGTVYRNLNLLRKRGEILELTYCNTFSRFDGNPINHYHFVCEKCERMFDLPGPVDPKIDASIAARTGFAVKGHRAEFYGVCRDCRDNLQQLNSGPERQKDSRAGPQ